MYLLIIALNILLFKKQTNFQYEYSSHILMKYPVCSGIYLGTQIVINVGKARIVKTHNSIQITNLKLLHINTVML